MASMIAFDPHGRSPVNKKITEALNEDQNSEERRK